ncbi:hypothetical protein E2C01_007300 [Portunus trituberculatus]|uniref:Uncharacterized protein n=1 Tax=Portunus trituberculatus TaxID=210409 RepID=A0A5B7CXT7_PORTR|nr:hypothetical protein [Portunus trituberculatus]
MRSARTGSGSERDSVCLHPKIFATGCCRPHVVFSKPLCYSYGQSYGELPPVGSWWVVSPGRWSDGRLSCQCRCSLVSHSILFSGLFTTPSFRLSSPNIYVPEGGREGDRGEARRVSGCMDNDSVTCWAVARGEHRGGVAWSACRAKLSPPSSGQSCTPAAAAWLINTLP